MPLQTRPSPAASDWLRLSLIEGLGPTRLLRLLRAFGGPADILATPAGQLAATVGAAIAARIHAVDPAREARVAASLEWLAGAADRHLLTLDAAGYPPAWLCLADPPPCVMVRGRLETLAAPAIAIVGSRHASTNGARTAHDFAASLASEGWCIASGLALGIDAAAHAGALDAGGPTIAFVGTGIDQDYPARNRGLARRIAATGAIVSEFALGTEPLPGNFPRRNRLIAAHARGVLVVEAARQSGSLITALEAAGLGREVFAIPGSIHSPRARGCHWLIRQGAKLVEEVADLHDEIPAALRPPPGRGAAERAAAPTKAATAPGVPDVARAAAGRSAGADDEPWGPAASVTLAGLDWHPASADELAQRLPFGMPTLLAALLELELAGQVERLADGRYQRCATIEAGAAATRPGRPVRVARRIDRPV